MSCHVMSCRHCCINSKKSFSKTFSFHKIIYKYFAGFLACIYDIIRCHYEGNARDICPPLASNPISVDCHASLHQRGQTPVRLAMTKKILSLRGFVKTEVIHKKEILLFWIASLHFVSLAMTEKIKIAHAVRHMAMTITKIFNSISFRDYSLLFIKN